MNKPPWNARNVVFPNRKKVMSRRPTWTKSQRKLALALLEENSATDKLLAQVWTETEFKINRGEILKTIRTLVGKEGMEQIIKLEP